MRLSVHIAIVDRKGLVGYLALDVSKRICVVNVDLRRHITVFPDVLNAKRSFIIQRHTFGGRVGKKISSLLSPYGLYILGCISMFLPDVVGYEARPYILHPRMAPPK